MKQTNPEFSIFTRELKLNAGEKTLHAGEKFEDFENHFRIK
jgi:hypothetical protein